MADGFVPLNFQADCVSVTASIYMSPRLGKSSRRLIGWRALRPTFGKRGFISGDQFS
jgi:hypothetical protein